ncbi:MAG: thiamine pyrophosphate-dependent enzyme, partial [Methanothrix sp.]|nr:thiamine pyrophosphate-dependent enzyme [Methanothrix sp.]
MNMKASQAIGLAMLDSGVELVTYVPALGATEIYCDCCATSGQEQRASFHEEVAYTIAHGTALAGKRASTVLKTHGFIKAGNSVSDSLFSGTNAGFVAIVVDDRNGIQSDSIVDTPAFLEGIGIPYKIAEVENIYRDVLEAFRQSEKLSLPYALVLDASETDKPSEVRQEDERKSTGLRSYGSYSYSRIYSRNISQHVLCPPFCKYQQEVLRSKLHGDDWSLVSRPRISPIPQSLPLRWRPTVEKYAPLFEAFRSFKGRMVAGDTGHSTLFALPPYDCIDVTTYMGGSIPIAIGAYLAGLHPAWAITGDFSFIAAGHLGLLDALQRRTPVKVLILNNGEAETTGGQRIPEGMLERVLRSCREFVDH